MASIDQIRASDGSGNASVATVQSTRAGGASTIVVDTVLGINGTFYGTMGTPHTFTDPVTSETITVISEATAVDFAGHVDGSNLEIDTIAPGYVDNGSAVGDIVIIRPTTQWGDNVADVLDVAHRDDGQLKATVVYDVNDNETLKLASTASAVNEVTLTNAATGNGPTISATGGDTNVDLNFAPKGTGKLKGVVNNLHQPYKFSASTSTESITTTPTTVIFDTEDFDTGGIYNAGTGVFTAPIAGFYIFTVVGSAAGISNSGSNYLLSRLYKNGATAIEFSRATAPGLTGSTQSANGTIMLQLAADDTIEFQAWNTYNVGFIGIFQGWLLCAT